MACRRQRTPWPLTSRGSASSAARWASRGTDPDVVQTFRSAVKDDALSPPFSRALARLRQARYHHERLIVHQVVVDLQRVPELVPVNRMQPGVVNQRAVHFARMVNVVSRVSEILRRRELVLTG